MTFHVAYGALLKASFTTLRKRDKKREKQRARRKQRMAEPGLLGDQSEGTVGGSVKK